MLELLCFGLEIMIFGVEDEVVVVVDGEDVLLFFLSDVGGCRGCVFEFILCRFWWDVFKLLSGCMMFLLYL